MTKLNTHTKRTVAIVVLMILLAMFFGNIRTMVVSTTETVGFAAESLRSLIYICLFAAWGISTWQRIIQTQVRRYLACISALMVVWMLVRSMKFLFFNGTAVGRYCWYLYYFPMLFIPVLVLFVALSLGIMPAKVTLLCANEMMDVIVDKFGKDVETKKVSDGQFEAYVKVNLSPRFYGWVFGFAGKIKIKAPETVKAEYAKLARQALK